MLVEPSGMHEIWRVLRRPFRYPCCKGQCVWEVYDVNQAGCLKCGKHHCCKGNAVDNTCPLIQCDDRTRVCDITGYVLPEVRHAANEFCDTVVHAERHPKPAAPDMETEVYCATAMLLLGERATKCRELENAKQYARLGAHLHKQMLLFKLAQPDRAPNLCHLLAAAMQQERYWRFIEEASEDLVRHCAGTITGCLRLLKARGAKIMTATRMQDLVCGMLYMLKHGLTFQNRVLLSAIPEVDRCLPHENKIELYFGISSKVICMTENEVKLIFRESYQT